jgi:LPS sulfotransferase NodH
MMRPHTSYLIGATPRTGSYLLCEVLRNTGLVGRPTEYVSQSFEGYWSRRWGTSTYGEYLDKVIETGTTPNGVFGLKTHLYQFNYFVGKLRQIPEYRELGLPDLLSTIFPNLHYIWLTRRDKVRQAVSFLRARQSNIWSQTDEPLAPVGKPTLKEPRFDFGALDYIVQKMEEDEASWQSYFNAWKVQPLVVVYEELVQAYEEIARRILEHLKIPTPPDLVFAEPHMKKQADALSEKWVERYQKLKRAQAQKTLAAFQGIHRGETIVVCGCGESLNDFTLPERSITIGVNDVGRRFQPNYLVVLDPREKLKDYRFHYVETSQADFLFASCELGVQHPNIVKFALRQKKDPDFSDSNGLQYTARPYYSPYFALCLAMQMGASRIGLIGVDFADNHFFGPTGPYPGARHLPEVERQFRHLNDVLIARGVKVFNLSSRSRITAFPKMLQEDFKALAGSALAVGDARAPLRIICYVKKPLDSVTTILARCINARTPHYARCLCGQNGESRAVFEEDINWAKSPRTAEAELAKADVVIVDTGIVEPDHHPLLTGKAIITLVHGCSGQVARTFVERGFPGALMGHCPAMLAEFKGWSVVPPPVPLWERAYQPGEKESTLTICYTRPNQSDRHRREHGLDGYSEEGDPTLRILERLARKYPIRVEVVADDHLSQGEGLGRRAHIVMDDCVTGGYHRTSLEGLAVGSAVVNGVGRRAEVLEAFRYCAGGESSKPFVYANLDVLEGVLASLIRRGSASLAQEGMWNRQWMEEHWDFAWQWEQFWLPLISSAMRHARSSSPIQVLPTHG